MSDHINITLSRDECDVMLQALESYKKIGMSQKEWLGMASVYKKIEKKRGNIELSENRDNFI